MSNTRNTHFILKKLRKKQSYHTHGITSNSNPSSSDQEETSDPDDINYYADDDIEMAAEDLTTESDSTHDEEYDIHSQVMHQLFFNPTNIATDNTTDNTPHDKQSDNYKPKVN